MSAPLLAEGPLFHDKPNIEQYKQKRAASWRIEPSCKSADNQKGSVDSEAGSCRDYVKQSTAPMELQLMELSELLWSPKSTKQAGCKTNHISKLYANKRPPTTLLAQNKRPTGRSLSTAVRVTPTSSHQRLDRAYRVGPSARKSSPDFPVLFVVWRHRQWAHTSSYKRHPKSSSLKPRERRPKQQPLPSLLQRTSEVSIYLLMKQHTETLMDCRYCRWLGLRLRWNWHSSIGGLCLLGPRLVHDRGISLSGQEAPAGPSLSRNEEALFCWTAIKACLHSWPPKSRRDESKIAPSKNATTSHPPPILSPDHYESRPSDNPTESTGNPKSSLIRPLPGQTTLVAVALTGASKLLDQSRQARCKKCIRPTCIVMGRLCQDGAAALKIDFKERRTANNKSNLMVKLEQILKYKPHVKIKKPSKFSQLKEAAPRLKLNNLEQADSGCYAQPPADTMIDVSFDVAYLRRPKQPALREPLLGRHSCFCQGKIDKAGAKQHLHRFLGSQDQTTTACLDGQDHCLSKLLPDVASPQGQDVLAGHTIGEPVFHELATVPLAACTRPPANEPSPKPEASSELVSRQASKRAFNAGQINKFVKCTKVPATVRVTSESEMGHILPTINQVSSASNCCCWRLRRRRQNSSPPFQQPIRWTPFECKPSHPHPASTQQWPKRADRPAPSKGRPCPTTWGQEVTSQRNEASLSHLSASWPGKPPNYSALIYSKRRHHLVVVYCLLLLHCLMLSGAHRSSPVPAAAVTFAPIKGSFVIEPKDAGKLLLDEVRWSTNKASNRDFEQDLRRLARRSAANPTNLTAEPDQGNSIGGQQKADSVNQQPVYRWPFIGLVSFMFIGAAGNILVCMAVWRERRLQTATNYFLLSLAVADLLVCTLVMPFGIIYEFYGHWPFDWRICNLWVTCDVLTCSSSILHMCFISVGRYLGIRNPLHARQANLFVSRRAVLWRIAIAWLSSALIASPITMMSIYNHENIIPSPNECAISNKYFLLFGSLLAFFIPMFVMVPSYIMTVRLLSRRAEFVRNNSLLMTNASNYQLQAGKQSNTDYINDANEQQNSDNPCIDYSSRTKRGTDSNNNDCNENEDKQKDAPLRRAESTDIGKREATDHLNSVDMPSFHKSMSFSRCDMRDTYEGVHSASQAELRNNTTALPFKISTETTQSASIFRRMIEPTSKKSSSDDQNHSEGQSKYKVEFATLPTRRINGARSLEDRLNEDLKDTRYIDDNDQDDDNRDINNQTCHYEANVSGRLCKHDGQMHTRPASACTAVAIRQDMDGWVNRNLGRDFVHVRQQWNSTSAHRSCQDTKNANSAKSIANRPSDIIGDNVPNSSSSFTRTDAPDRQLEGTKYAAILSEHKADNDNKAGESTLDKKTSNFMVSNGKSLTVARKILRQMSVGIDRNRPNKCVNSELGLLASTDINSNRSPKTQENDLSSLTCRTSTDNDIQTTVRQQQQGVSSTRAQITAYPSLTAKQMTPRLYNDLDSGCPTCSDLASNNNALICRLRAEKDDKLPNLTSVSDSPSTRSPHVNSGEPKVNDDEAGANSSAISILIVQDSESEHTSSRSTDRPERTQPITHHRCRQDGTNSLSFISRTLKLEGPERLNYRPHNSSGHHYPLSYSCHHGSCKRYMDSASLDHCLNSQGQIVAEQSRHHSRHHRHRCHHHRNQRRHHQHNSQSSNQTKTCQHNHHHHHRHHHRHCHGKLCINHDNVGNLNTGLRSCCSQKRSQRHICSSNQKSETEDENYICSNASVTLSLPASKLSLLSVDRTRRCCSPSGSSSCEGSSYRGSKEDKSLSLHKSIPDSPKLKSNIKDQVEHQATVPEATGLTLMSSSNGNPQYCGHTETTAERLHTPNTERIPNEHRIDYNKKDPPSKRRRSNMNAESALGASIMAAAIPILSSVTSKSKGSKLERDAVTRTSSSNNSSLGGQSNQHHGGNHQSFQMTSSTDTQNEPQMIRYLGSTSMQVRSEQKATKVLGVVFFTFVICWTPFFVINFTQAFVERQELAKWISNEMMTTFLWLGYISSTINPVIYTVFNRNFRRAFRQLICCREASHLYNRRTGNSEMTKSFRFSHYGRQHAQSGSFNHASIYNSIGSANRKFSMKNNVASMGNNNNVNDQNNVTRRHHHIGGTGGGPDKLLTSNKGGETMLMLDDDQSPAIHRQERSSLLNDINNNNTNTNTNNNNNRSPDGHKRNEKRQSISDISTDAKTGNAGISSTFVRCTYQVFRNRIIKASSALFSSRQPSFNATHNQGHDYDSGYLNDDINKATAITRSQHSDRGRSNPQASEKRTNRPKLSFARVDSDDK